MKEVSVEQLKEMMDNQEDIMLIDVREEYEFETANIGGFLLPMGTVPHQLDEIPKNKKIIVHCKSGQRSANVVRYLETQGYKDVHNLTGGIFAWIDRIDPSLPKY